MAGAATNPSPDVFAYASVVAGIVITLLYNSDMLLVSFGIAAVVAVVGPATAP